MIDAAERDIRQACFILDVVLHSRCVRRQRPPEKIREPDLFEIQVRMLIRPELIAC
jgi:hypothetical protein